MVPEVRLKASILDIQDMHYEPQYSQTHLHFVSEPPMWLPLLDRLNTFRSILDLGAGGGHNSVFLQRLFPQARIVAADLSLVRCRACRQVAPISVVCGDAMYLPFENGSFDFVISTQVIEHVPDDEEFVSEVKRVLKPGGLSLISSVVRLPFGWYFYRNQAGAWVLDPTHVREYQSVRAYQELFVDGLAVLQTEVDSFRFSPFRFLYRALHRARLIKNADPNYFREAKWGPLLERLRVPVPRYRHVTVVARKLEA